MKRYIPLFAVIMYLLSCVSVAQDWLPAKGSKLTFSSSFQSESFSGEFSRFTPQIRFDPKQLTKCRFDVSIDLLSVDSQNKERDDTLKTADFFDTKKTPSARFVATKFTSLGGNRYQANGTLSLRGISKPVALKFTWVENKGAVLTGDATVNRLDFNIGTGDWSDTELLPNAVKIQTRLILTAKPATTPVPAVQ
jgi:polyisoprenoid-binding protein YceI